MRTWDPSAEQVRMWIGQLYSVDYGDTDTLRCILIDMLESIPSFQIAQDPCEWNSWREDWITSAGEAHARAEVIVGATGERRLCRSCAALPRFKRFRKRVEIGRIER